MGFPRNAVDLTTHKYNQFQYFHIPSRFLRYSGSSLLNYYYVKLFREYRKEKILALDGKLDFNFSLNTKDFVFLLIVDV